MERDRAEEQSPIDVLGSTMKNAADALAGDPGDHDRDDASGIYSANQGYENRDPDLGEEDVDSGPGSA